MSFVSICHNFFLSFSVSLSFSLSFFLLHSFIRFFLSFHLYLCMPHSVSLSVPLCLSLNPYFFLSFSLLFPFVCLSISSWKWSRQKGVFNVVTRVLGYRIPLKHFYRARVRSEEKKRKTKKLLLQLRRVTSCSLTCKAGGGLYRYRVSASPQGKVD